VLRLGLALSPRLVLLVLLLVLLLEVTRLLLVGRRGRLLLPWLRLLLRLWLLLLH
jgi:hypothetical protein